LGEWKKAQKKPIVVEYRFVRGHQEDITTKEGTLTATRGIDYIIRGVEGELYPIKIDIFEKTYVRIGE
jgi:hypothetical protein